MGKYPPSRLRMYYSEWHYKKLGRKAWAMDIDMLEVRKVDGVVRPVAITEICRFNDKLKPIPNATYKWLRDVTGLPVYIIECNSGFDKFAVREYGESNDDKRHLNEHDFIDFMNNIEIQVPSCNRYDREVDYSAIERVFNEFIQTDIPNHTQYGLNDFV